MTSGMRASSFVLACLAALAGSCAPRPAPAAGRSTLAALQGAGLPLTAAQMVREPPEVICAGGGRKLTQLQTVRARGETREVRITTTYRRCQVGATTLDGMLFTHVIHTTDTGQGTRIYGNIDGALQLGGNLHGSCQVALAVEAHQGEAALGGTICGADAISRRGDSGA